MQDNVEQIKMKSYSDMIAQGVANSVDKDNMEQLSKYVCRALIKSANPNLLYCPNCNEETNPCGFGRDIAKSLTEAGISAPEQLKLLTTGWKRQLLTDFVYDIQNGCELVLLDDEQYVRLADIKQLRKDYLNEDSSK